MAYKERISPDWLKSSTRQLLLLQMLEKGERRRHPRLPVAREVLLVLAAGGALLMLLALMLKLCS